MAVGVVTGELVSDAVFPVLREFRIKLRATRG